MNKTVGNQGYSFVEQSGYNANSMATYSQGLSPGKQYQPNPQQLKNNLQQNTYKHSSTHFNRNSLLVNEPTYSLNSAKTSNPETNNANNFFRINNG